MMWQMHHFSMQQTDAKYTVNKVEYEVALLNMFIFMA